jgi:hypothetical protein
MARKVLGKDVKERKGSKKEDSNYRIGKNVKSRVCSQSRTDTNSEAFNKEKLMRHLKIFKTMK